MYTYIHEYYWAIKELNLSIWDNMDGPRYYAKWKKSERKRQIPYNFTYMYNLKTKGNE